jgi:NADH:ubiquinone reductase (H+-translocating)
MTTTPQIVVLGGGYVGMFTALRLRRKLRGREAAVTVVDPSSTMTYQPFLAEVAGGSVEPRHVVVPLRPVLRGCRVLAARVVGLDPGRRRVTVETATGERSELPYDVLVVALGAVARTVPVPGLAAHAVGFGTVAEAVHLRNQVLGRLGAAAAATDPDRRRAALSFTVVGGGYSGVEVLGELEDLVRYALRHHPELDPAELRWTLVEAADRVLPEVSLSLAGYTVQRLRRRGVDVRLGTRLVSVEGGRVRLSDGTQHDADTVVWTAGVRANPAAARLGLPVDPAGRVLCTADLRVQWLPGVWAAGDVAAVPDLASGTPGALCGPSAQHAVRQARRLAGNVVAELRGRPVRPYRHPYAGSVASLGLHKGVAEVYGIRLRGLPAWLLHRAYHLMQVPTLNRKVRVLADWAVAAVLPREVAELGPLEDPGRDWRAAVGDGRAAA